MNIRVMTLTAAIAIVAIFPSAVNAQGFMSNNLNINLNDANLQRSMQELTQRLDNNAGQQQPGASMVKSHRQKHNKQTDGRIVFQKAGPDVVPISTQSMPDLTNTNTSAAITESKASN